MTFPGAPSALRGYRLQHLYSLFRILDTNAPIGSVFRLEGTEDLDLFDAAGQLIEAIQVKARSSAPLAPSALTTRSGESFFRRAMERLERCPQSRQRVVSFSEVETAFAKSRVALVHGASGQGKTALACRYLLAADPSAWRFHIRELQDIPHARRVALSLRAHADAVGVPMIVWFDVSPQDTAWTRVVDDLESLPNTRVLITIREEDWTRAQNAGATLRYAEVALTLDEHEARQIFDGLQQYRISPEFLDFDDAWRQFGGAGPLMEFTYIVTRGDALETTLEQQIRRLREEVRLGMMSAAEIELLRRVAVATAAGGRVCLRQVIADLAVADAKASLERFEREYLLRISPGGLVAEGLHPLRSTTIARLLTEDAFDPRWIETAIAVLPAIAEPDLEPFLLSLFSQPVYGNRLKTALNTFKPKSWSGGAGVVRALLWCGMREYASENAELVNEVVEQRKGSELALAVIDPADLQRFSLGLTELMEKIFSATPEIRVWYEDILTRKPPNACVTRDASRWLCDTDVSFDVPTSASDWEGMAELLFWCAAWGCATQERAAAAVADITRAANEITLDAVADVVLALSFWDVALLPETFEKVRQSLTGRFQDEMRVFAIDHTEGATAHYIAPFEESLDLHEETIRRLGLMRRLLPEEPTFGAQAYGHIFGSELFPHDPSTKKGVPASSFPIPWVVRLGHLFSFIAGVQMRGASWSAYADGILKLRRRLADLASETSGALRKYFNKEKPRNIFELGVQKDEWLHLSIALKDLPRLPASSVDAWGVELRDISKIHEPFEAPADHADWSEALQAYTNAFYAFLESSTPYFLANCHVGRPATGSRDRAAKVLEGTTFKAHLATYHLAEVVRSLRRLQREYRLRLARFVDPGTLAQLDADEQSWLWTLWAVWYQFAEQPKQRFADARRESLAAVEAVRKRRHADLKRRLDSITAAEVVIHQERDQWNEAKGLWLTMNTERSGGLYDALEATLSQVVEALRPPPDFHAFDWYVLDLVWRDVHVVPVVRGKSVARTAWHFRIVALPQPGESIEAWKLLDLPVDNEIWRELDVEVWPSTLGGAARSVQTEFANLVVLLNHRLRFEGAPKPDVVGKSILEGHWSEVIDAVRWVMSDGSAASLSRSRRRRRVSSMVVGCLRFIARSPRDPWLVGKVTTPPLSTRDC